MLQYNKKLQIFLTRSAGQRRVYVPSEDEMGHPGVYLRTRFMVAAHQGSRGHGGVTATHDMLKRYVHWPGMSADVKAFVASCLNCVKTKGGPIVPRPFGSAIHADRAFEVIHADFLDMGVPDADGNRYIMLIVDDLSSLVMLHPCRDQTAATAAEALSKWFSQYGTPEYLVTDGGPHFANQLLVEITETYGIEHHITTAYTAQANGTVERANRIMVRKFQALASDLGIPPSEWTRLVAVVQFIMNQAPRPSLGGKSPAHIAFGRTPPKEMYPGSLIVTKPRPGRLVRLDGDNLVAHTQDLHEAIRNVHKDTAALRSKRRGRAHPSRRFTHPLPDLHVGTFVLVSKQTRDNKVKTFWKGPCVVTDVINDHTVMVRHVLAPKAKPVKAHVQNVRVYNDKHLDSSVPTVSKILTRDDTDVETQITSIHDIGFSDSGPTSGYYVTVKADGYLKLTNRDLRSVIDTAPRTLCSFLKKNRRRYDKSLWKEVKRLLVNTRTDIDFNTVK